MHICHVTSSLKGGPIFIIGQLVDAQLRSGHQVSLVFSNARDDEAEARAWFPPNVRLFPWHALREIDIAQDTKAYFHLSAVLRELRPDILHAHNSKAGALGRIAAKRHGLPVIYSPHGLAYLQDNVAATKRAVFFAMEWGLALFCEMITASSKSEMSALRWLPCRKSLVNNGMNVPELEAAASGEPAVPRSRRFRIVVCGRIDPQKSPSLVAKIAAQSPSDWEWVWVGEGALRPVLEECGRITITGWLPRQKSLATIRSADVYLQASGWEGMSIALLEAMALGRPCVVSGAVGNRDLVRTLESGFVCRNEVDYLSALSTLEHDQVLRARLGSGAAETIEKHFSQAAVIRAWSAAYRRVLRNRISAFSGFASAETLAGKAGLQAAINS